MISKRAMHNMEKLFQDLKKNIRGTCRFDTLSKKIYSVDASIYEVEPLGIIIPLDKEDVLTALQIAAQHKVPITPRGAATGITGSCLGYGLILDMAQNLNQILEINIDKEYAICQPGVVQDRLNEALAPHGYRLGPDTSTGNRATLGGMTANNSAGARSLRYGAMVQHVDTLEIALASGHLITTTPLTESQWLDKCRQNNIEALIYQELTDIRNNYADAISQHFPKIPRRVSGYNLDHLIKPFPLNLSQLIVGSEGTLGLITEIKVGIAKKPRHTSLCIIHTENMIKDLHAIEAMLAHQPIALEMIDEKILTAARLSPTVKQKLQWLSGNPQAVFVAEFEGASPQEVESKVAKFAAQMKREHIGYAHIILQDASHQQDVWDVRKAGLGLLLSKRSYSRAIAFIEDITIGPHQLPDFLDEFCQYLKSLGKEAGIYGHIGSGCMHIRPYIDLRQPTEIHTMKKIMDDVSSMVLRYGGALSGEHGDGLIRSWLNEKMFGKEVYTAFKKVKNAFDPHNLMNPGKIVDGPPLEQNLRLNPQSVHATIPTFLDFTAEGGIELAADLCNGNGQCRKKENVMCPSFQASNDEYQTTRARAQSLRAVIHGKLPLEEFSGQALYDVLDLCIECKGCKRECPSQVDMAKMKSEFLYQYQEKHGYSLRNRLFAHLPTLNKFMSPFATLFNAMVNSPLAKPFLSLLGISTRRSLPTLAKQPFSKWFALQKQTPKIKKLVIFNDTYTEYNHPEIGQAAFKVLSALNYEIILAHGQCCGRPLISKGLLPEAQTYARKVTTALHPYAHQNLPIIMLEPSCFSAIIDDYKGLLGKDPTASENLKSVINCTQSLDQFLEKHIVDGKLPLPFIERESEVLVHGHCHQKALVGTQATLEVLKAVPGFHVKEIASGCCGVAGAFGYEKEHYEFSLKIGELRLLPTIRQAPSNAIIVASGMSCRCQIDHGTSHKALHLAEALANRL